MKKLEAAHVLIAGLGAVGSYAAEGCARTGVGKITLADFDVVSESNINRQLYALNSTVGKKKNEIAASRIADINPACEIAIKDIFMDGNTIAELLDCKPDIVIDAIDTFESKLELLAQCAGRGIKVFSSMGAARKCDPSKIRTGEIRSVTYCPLARKLRQALKKRGVGLDTACVFSEEIPAQCQDVSAEPVREGLKRRPFGSLGTVTGIFGLTLANMAIMHIIKD